MKQRMKKTIYSLVILTAIIFLIGCNDGLLDQEPKDRIAESSVWQDMQLVNLFMNNIYGNLLSVNHRIDQPAGQEWSRGFSTLDCATDDCDAKHDAFVQNHLRNAITPSSQSHFDEQWREGYKLIRKANVLIARIDDVPSTDPAINARMKAEARFLRAFVHFQTATFFGGIPIIDRELSIDDELQVSRNTFDEVIDFVVSEMDALIAESALPPATDKSGRATIGAAMALKAKALLFHASPLFNPGNNVSRWELAANAAQDVIDLGVYQLYNDFANVIRHEGNIEIIWDRRYLAPNNVKTSSFKLEMTQTGVGGGGWGGLHPTEDLVSSFETTDGRAITDPLSIYDPNNPYENRDSRLDATINHNGSIYKGRRVQIFDDGDAAFEGPTITSSPEDGLQAIRPPGTDWPTCGYGLGRKIQNEALNTSTLLSQGDGGPDVYIRYADILLMFAEARNEATGPIQAVHDAINSVRNRAGQPDLPAGLSQDEMRKRIVNERRVELAFEEHRLFDLNRWLLAEVYLSQPTRGLRAVPKDIPATIAWLRNPGSGQSPYPDEGGAGFTYTEFLVPGRDRIWDDKRYLLPIPQAEIDKNPNLTQNPGWQ